MFRALAIASKLLETEHTQCLHQHFFICSSTGAQIQIENFKQLLFPFFARALLYNFHIFDVRPLALTYIKMLKIEVGPNAIFLITYFLLKIFSIIMQYYYYVL